MTTLLYAYGFNLEEIRKILRFHFHLVLKSFEENYMVLNADKCYFIYLGKDSENEPFILNNFIFNNSNEEMLGINIGNKAIFKSHFKILCKKVTQKIVALLRLLNHLNDSRKRLVFNSIIKSQFNSCPLIWMFCSKASNNVINRIRERALRLILNDLASDLIHCYKTIMIIVITIEIFKL